MLRRLVLSLAVTAPLAAQGTAPVATVAAVVAASLVCIVPITKWPVSEALIAISIVSRSRSSPITITSGSSRNAYLSADANDGVSVPTSR